MLGSSKQTLFFYPECHLTDLTELQTHTAPLLDLAGLFYNGHCSFGGPRHRCRVFRNTRISDYPASAVDQQVLTLAQSLLADLAPLLDPAGFFDIVHLSFGAAVCPAFLVRKFRTSEGPSSEGWPSV